MTFAETPDTLTAKFASIVEATWLGGGRWALVSPEFNAVVVADFEKRSVTRLGDAKALQHPFHVFAAGDTIYVLDWGLRRLTRWSGGKLVNALPVPAATNGVMPRARDAAGQYYFETSPSPGRDGGGNKDSAAIIRASPDLTRFDTIARLAPLDLAEVARNNTRRFERRVFSGNDFWGVLSNGTLWISRVYQNLVEWIDPRGQHSFGPALPDPVLEVTPGDREVFIRQFPEDLRMTAEDLPFALIKPAFESGHHSPDGLVWLEKSRVLMDSVRRYQVITRTGDLDHVVVLPGNGHVMALGDSSALVVEQFKEGVRFLQMRVPRVPIKKPGQS